MALDLAVTAAAKAVDGLVRLARIRIGLGPLGNIDVSLSTPFTRESIDERLAKIESARSSLTDALGAMDELKVTAESNRRDLDSLTAAIAKAESDKADLNAQLEALQQIATIDSGIVREALHLPTSVDIWKERIYGFLIGIISGFVVTFAWELWLKPTYFESHQPAQQEQPRTQ
jgi:hypothetical protein